MKGRSSVNDVDVYIKILSKREALLDHSQDMIPPMSLVKGIIQRDDFCLDIAPES